ncbi:methylmalonyl-CoA epimerase [Kiritimatiellota bacterium B12222]|nr:methylmalonyl-CoA epimerase [Kiritimatiellota bacterium B12222]
MIQKVDHIGIAVRSLEEAMPLYEKALGLKFLKMEEVESQKVRTAFYEAGETHIELLEPTAEDSPIAIFLEKKGEGIHHIAFGTDDVLGQLAQASGEGVRLIHETPIDGAGGKQVAFLHPKSTKGVLTELCSH